MKIKLILQGAFWVMIYIFITLLPLILLLTGDNPPGREFWREFSVALGFVGLAMMALQFVLTARFRRLKAPYGSDIIYHFHRQISLIAFALILSHPIILFLFNAEYLKLLNLITAPWRARAGVSALVLLMFVIGLSLWRKQLKIDYTAWRIGHGVLATLVVSLALIHVMLVNYYVNTPLKRLLWVGYGLFWISLLLWVRVIKPFILLRKPYEVVQVNPERGNTWTVVLKPKNHRGMRFMPGQFTWLTAWASPFSDAEHPFSISSSAEKSDQLSLTIKEFGDFTRRIKDLKPGQEVYLDGPFGSFSIDRHPHAKGFIFIAGGVGITPIMSMLRTLADRNDQRPLILLYANKTWDGVTFREELDALQQKLNLKVIHVIESPPDGWKGERGYVTQELLARTLPADYQRNRWEIFICGPDAMMNSVENSLSKIGVWIGDFHSERFYLV